MSLAAYQRRQSAAEADKAILAVLTDAQKVALGGAKLADAMLPHYKKVKLTDDQTAKLRGACAIASRKLTAITGDDRKDNQARTTIQKSLKWAVDNVILTPEQRGEVAPKPATRPAAAPK
jgi:hypothetical protein